MRKKLKIAQIVPPWIPVPPKKYGGTELIASYLTEELVLKGHKITLFASGDSKTKAKLISIFPKSLYNENISWQDAFSPLLQTVSLAKKLKDFDIIHNHFHYWGLALSFLTNTEQKTVTTYHGDFNSILKNSAKWRLLETFKKSNFISISNSQRKVKGIKINFIANIYNGIDVSKFNFKQKQGDYLVWLGRITPKKGVLESIEIAKKAKMNLKIAAKIDKKVSEDVNFYNQKVKPLIDGNQIKYIGEIGGHEEKSKLFENAFALLNPIKWAEPFGLNMAEAMACGTPVIAFDRGSVREVVKDKKTGFIVNNINEAVEAIKKIDSINREECRKRVEKLFNKKKMVEQYEEIYYKILK